MPTGGGSAQRLTYSGGTAVRGWASATEVLCATTQHNGLPDEQLVRVSVATGAVAVYPLSQAIDGAVDQASGCLTFTRAAPSCRQRLAPPLLFDLLLSCIAAACSPTRMHSHFSFPFGYSGLTALSSQLCARTGVRQASKTKRYVGGTAERLWQHCPGELEARPLTADFTGTSRHFTIPILGLSLSFTASFFGLLFSSDCRQTVFPVRLALPSGTDRSPRLHGGRIYFLSDRSGVMNVWSMAAAGGSGKQQLTDHTCCEPAAALSIQGTRRVELSQREDVLFFAIWIRDLDSLAD